MFFWSSDPPKYIPGPHHGYCTIFYKYFSGLTSLQSLVHIQNSVVSVVEKYYRLLFSLPNSVSSTLIPLPSNIS